MWHLTTKCSLSILSFYKFKN